MTRTVPPDPRLRVVSCAERPLAAHAAALAEEVGQGPSLWLLAAAGDPPASFEVVRRVLPGRRSPAEAVIALDVDALRRSAEVAHLAPTDAYTEKAARAAKAHVTAVMGSASWHGACTPDLSVARRNAALLELYSAALRGCGVTVAAYGIEFRPGRARQWLVFCTREPDHVPAAGDALRDVEDGLVRDASAEDTLGLFDEPLDFIPLLVRRRRTQLAGLIQAGFAGGGRTCLRDVRRRFTLSHFGQYDKPDYQAAIEALTHAGAWRTTHAGTCRDDNDPLISAPPSQPEKAP